MCSQGILPLFGFSSFFIPFRYPRGLPGSVDPVLKLADFGFARALPEQDMVRISADNKLATRWSSKECNPLTWGKHGESLYMIYIYNLPRCMYRYIQLTQRITPTYILIYSYSYHTWIYMDGGGYWSMSGTLGSRTEPRGFRSISECGIEIWYIWWNMCGHVPTHWARSWLQNS